MMRFFEKKHFNQEKNTTFALPRHLGIIMDGNRRWANKRALPIAAGHAAGAIKFKEITRYCANRGIQYLTVYAFSTENWNRSNIEIQDLMKLFKTYLNNAIKDFLNENIKVYFIGDISKFSGEVIDLIQKTEDVSKNRHGMILNIAMNYGGRSELVRATQLIAKDILEKKLLPEDIAEKNISDHLYTAGQPDVDLVIRASGEFRTSNFLLWQSVYAEYVITDILWPDFTAKDLEKAFLLYSQKDRRFGGV